MVASTCEGPTLVARFRNHQEQRSGGFKRTDAANTPASAPQVGDLISQNMWRNPVGCLQLSEGIKLPETPH